ncbi:hypothetical protein CVT26_002554 [Gymnopilus dilepis]|uniref:F-box domain-containing protein n=1 Tax=Gymnopilus dilepis TaxID=231916 RepID=A0A409Y3Q9_9AGAR|nr:hypothetical protein CVT26_002554 [Gymnopilus dilepis]
MELHDDIWFTILEELRTMAGSAPTLKALRCQSRYFHEKVTPILFDRLALVSPTDIQIWERRLLQHEKNVGQGAIEIFWLKGVKTLELRLDSQEDLKELRSFVTRILPYIICQLSELCVSGDVWRNRQTDCQWVIELLRDRCIKDFTFGYSTLPKQMLNFLDCKSARSLQLRRVVHFHEPADWRPSACLLGADLQLYHHSSEFSGWKRVRAMRIDALNEETLSLAHECSNLLSLKASIVDGFVDKTSLLTVKEFPNFNKLRSLTLITRENILVRSMAVMVEKIIGCSSTLRELAIQFFLDWDSVEYGSQVLQELFRIVSSAERPGLASIQLEVSCYIPLLPVIREHEPDAVDKILEIATALDVIDGGGSLVNTAFLNASGKRLSTQQLRGLFHQNGHKIDLDRGVRWISPYPAGCSPWDV